MDIKGDHFFQIARWANKDKTGQLLIGKGELPITMHNSDGTGMQLLKDGSFGADMIRFPPGKGVMNHTHEGSHILFVIHGSGYVVYDGVSHELEPGLCYLIPRMIDHEIRAISELILLVVGNDHQSLDSFDRMEPSVAKS